MRPTTRYALTAFAAVAVLAAATPAFADPIDEAGSCVDFVVKSPTAGSVINRGDDVTVTWRNNGDQAASVVGMTLVDATGPTIKDLKHTAGLPWAASVGGGQFAMAVPKDDVSASRTYALTLLVQDSQGNLCAARSRPFGLAPKLAVTPEPAADPVPAVAPAPAVDPALAVDPAAVDLATDAA